MPSRPSRKPNLQLREIQHARSRDGQTVVIEADSCDDYEWWTFDFQYLPELPPLMASRGVPLPVQHEVLKKLRDKANGI